MIIAVSMWLPTPCKPANVSHVWPPCQQTACLNLFLSLNVPTTIKMLPTKIRPILAWVIIKIHPPHRVIFGLKPYTLGRPWTHIPYTPSTLYMIRTHYLHTTYELPMPCTSPQQRSPRDAGEEAELAWVEGGWTCIFECEYHVYL